MALDQSRRAPVDVADEDREPLARALMIRPAAQLTEGAGYAVVLRDLVDDDGETVARRA